MSLAFVFGGITSALAGFIGMKAATKANVRTTAAAMLEGERAALNVSFNGGAPEAAVQSAANPRAGAR
jgi:K(+)-stimulated pyrophosphate-energized sodium pump